MSWWQRALGCAAAVLTLPIWIGVLLYQTVRRLWARIRGRQDGGDRLDHRRP